MANNVRTKPASHGVDIHRRKLFESRREREFYAFCDSILSLSDQPPVLCDLNDPESVAAHKAVSSPDKALTAFVQLAALRLRARRSMLFFFDSDYAYILAEATRTLSLQDDTKHEIEDSLWLGASKIPRGFSVCEVTADLSANDANNTKDPSSKSLAHIINNLTEDTRFCDLPYVKDGPRARFYAGVPITTARGYNIGALCVLDDKARDGVDEADVDFLREMSKTVMSHLEMVRAKTENQRSRNMTAALGAFVEGKSNSQDWRYRGASHASALSRRHRPLASVRGNSDSSTRQRYRASAHGSSSPPAISKDVSPGTTSTSFQNGLSSSDSRIGSSSSKGEQIALTDFVEELPQADDSTVATRTPEDSFANEVKKTLSRAANLILEAVGVDGVMFLDATIGTFGGLVSSFEGPSDTDTATDGSRTSDDDNGGPLRARRRVRQRGVDASTASEPPRLTPVLGSAFSRNVLSVDGKNNPHAPFTEAFLNGLLHRYPEGHVWHFDAAGAASDDDLSDVATSTTSTAESGESDIEPLSSPASKRSHKRLRNRVRDAQKIRHLLPGVRSLVLVGMWDARQERWFGASVLWSYSSTRVLSVHQELTYLAAFCDVVLAEIWRLEAQNIERMKHDFVSSISHELRSPLHGILGNAECLVDREKDLVNQEMIRSIQSCGTTLLDIINHLLDYSHLNGDRRDSRQQGQYHMLQAHERGTSSTEIVRKSIVPVESGVLLSALTEECLSAVFSAFEHSSYEQGSKTAFDNKPVTNGNLNDAVTTTLNIDEAWSVDWNFDIPAGAWRRICINLFSNAMKYTREGYISITLSKRHIPSSKDGAPNACVELTVADSGIGMSEAFQAQNLFQPFRQEDSLTQGMGLGLSLVAKIAKSYGGTVEVMSRKDRGTTIIVAMPLAMTAPSAEPQQVTQDIVAQCAGVCVGLVGFDARHSTTAPATPESRFLSSVHDVCQQLGTHVQGCDSAGRDDARIHILRDADLRIIITQSDKTSVHRVLARPMVVICNTLASAAELRTVLRDRDINDTQFLWHPVGPAKLAVAISASCSLQDFGSGGIIAREPVKLPIRPKIPYQQTLTSSNCPTLLNNINQVLEPDASRAFTVPPDRVLDGSSSPLPVSGDELSNGCHTPTFHSTSSNENIEKAPIAPSFTVPLQPSQLPPPSNPSVNPQSNAAISLLLVDDNSVNLRLLVLFAKKAGLPFYTANDGLEAFEIYERAAQLSPSSTHQSSGVSLQEADPPVKKPNVILMDINMPVLDGYAATQRIRQFEQETGTRRATIIALTGLGNVEAQSKSFASGMDLFLTKPVRMKELTALLATLQVER